MSYNVMADNVTFKLIYQNTPWPELNFMKYRGPRMINEISQNLPEIICMQEIDHYTDFWKPELEKIGYQTFLNKRAKLFRHGALVGFQVNKWTLEQVENIDLNDASDQKEYKVHAAAIMAILTSKQSGKRILVCSLHTYFLGSAVKYLQLAYTLLRIQNFMNQNSSEDIPVILAGDFNALPQSEIIAYLYGKQPNINLAESEQEFEKFQQIYQKYPFIQEKWELSSAYDKYPNDLPNHVTHAMNFGQRVLDYIFYSQNGLKVTGLLKPAAQVYLQNSGGCPNKYFSSDHLRLEAEFAFD